MILDSMRKVGFVKLVQVQSVPLKVGHLYDPTPLVEATHLQLTPDGIVGIVSSGDKIIDIHHARHPQSHNTGKNAFSFGLTAHYALMRQTYGDHLQDGVAGENIVIECAAPLSLEELGDSIAFENPASGRVIVLDQVRAMAPCEQFSRFAAQQPDLSGLEMKQTLQSLSEGRRGFCAVPREFSLDATIRAGDFFYVSIAHG